MSERWSVGGGGRSITVGIQKSTPQHIRCHPMCAETPWTSTGPSMQRRADNDACPAPRENHGKITRKHDEPDDPTPTHECQDLRRRQVGRRCVRLCADLTVPEKPTRVSKEIKTASKPDDPTTSLTSRGIQRRQVVCFRRQVGVECCCVSVVVVFSKPEETKKCLNTRRTWRPDADVHSKQKSRLGVKSSGVRLVWENILDLRSDWHLNIS